MLTKRLAVMGAIAISTAFAQVSSAPTDMELLSPRQHHPMKDRVDNGNGTSTSTNWSGYAVTGTAFTSAIGSWVVPTATCTSGTQYASFWVGIDGFSSSSVEQTGTDSDCSGATPHYYAWYEFYPNPSFQISGLTIHPGDVMAAKVSFNGTQFTVTIKDETTGKAFSKSATVRNAARTSAEWIAEAPCCTSGNGILPLADFGTVLFGKDSTSVRGTNSATDSTLTNAVIGNFPAASINEINKTGSSSSPQLSNCSALSTDGTSFSCTWAP